LQRLHVGNDLLRHPDVAIWYEQAAGGSSAESPDARERGLDMTSRPPQARCAKLARCFAAAVTILAGALVFSGPAGAASTPCGPNVTVVDPSMSTSQVQAVVDAIASRQLSNQFGTERDTVLFM